MEVDRDPNRLTERLDEGRGGVGLAQPGHILDRKHVSAALLELPGELDVVGQGELCPGRIEDVAGVADRRLADPAGVADGVHGHLHVRHPVERVEHPEEVDPSGRGLLHEGRDDVVGVVGVADGIAGPEEHLEEDVRDLLPEAGEAVPGIFFEEPHRGVEGRAPPHLEREQPRGHPGVGIGDRKHVEGAHPGGEERLMRVAHRRVGHQQPLVIADPGGKLFRAELLKPCLRSRRWRREPVKLGDRCGGAPGRCRPPLYERIPVDDRVGEIFEEPGGPVAADGEVKQRRRVVDEARRATAGEELGVGDEIDQKRDVRLHATDAELLQAAFDVAGRLVERQSPRRHLHQERVEVGGDDGAGEGGAGVEADPHAAGRAVGGHPTVVGEKAVFGVFGRDAALDRRPHRADRVLVAEADLRVVEPVALGDANLPTDDVDPGDLLGDGVLDLDPRIDLDEIEPAGVGINEELDRPGVLVAGHSADRQGSVADRLPHAGVEVRRWGHLHHLLVAALD